jgi:pimeloyl-ACP methyl ester carboxylesterase
VLLAGGPGQAATKTFAPLIPVFARLNLDRDLLLIDIRGTGASAPLDCPSPDALGEQFRVGAMAETAARCLPTLDADPTQYTTEIIADDLDDVRAALGYLQIDMLGISYGTRLAMVYARRHPERLRAMVLDSVAPTWMAIPSSFPLDAQSALDAVLSRCSRDADCVGAFGDSQKRLDEVLASLPRPVDVNHPSSDEPVHFELGRAGFASLLRSLLYSPELAALLPLTIDRAARGDFDAFVAQASMLADKSQDGMSLGLMLSVICSEDLPRIDEREAQKNAEGSFVGSAVLDEFRSACATWPRATIPDAYHERVTLDAPSLLLSGQLDPVTPARWAEQALATLPRGRHLVVPGMAHGVSFRGCAPRLVRQFLEAPDKLTELDADCLEDDAPPFFVDESGPPP